MSPATDEGVTQQQFHLSIPDTVKEEYQRAGVTVLRQVFFE